MLARLLRCFALLIVVATAAAQGVTMRVELTSGEVLRGAVETLDSDHVVVATVGGARRVSIADVVSIRTLEQVPMPEAVAPPVDSRPSAAPPPTSAAVSGPDEVLIGLAERYLWFLPSSEGHRSSLGAAALVLMVLLVQLASRMANLDDRSLGRSATFATVVLGMIIAELTFVPVSPVLIIAVAAFDVAAWFVLGMVVFRADLFQGLVLMASFLLSAMVSLLVLQLAGVLLQADQALL